MKLNLKKLDGSGFTLVEIIVCSIIFPLIVLALSNGYRAVRDSYNVTRQLNEVYAVLSACPEIDRALEYDVITGSSNCYPNNSFLAENRSGKVLTYSPDLTITNTSDLAGTDPLQTIPDSKVIDVKVKSLKANSQTFELRMLITRNGIGQL